MRNSRFCRLVQTIVTRSTAIILIIKKKMRKIIEFFTGKKERFYLCLTQDYEHFKYFPLYKGKIYSEHYTTEIASVGFYANFSKKYWKRIV